MYNIIRSLLSAKDNPQFRFVHGEILDTGLVGQLLQDGLGHGNSIY